MKICKAETGQIINWQSAAENIKNVGDLKQYIEMAIVVPVEDQILLTSFAKPVRDEDLPQILQLIEEGEFIFCYDRRYLSARKDDIDALIDSETPLLEPKIKSFDGPLLFTQFKSSLRNLSLDEICNAYLSLFAEFEAFNQELQKTTKAHGRLSKLLVGEQKMQGMALQVAMNNLGSHTRHLETHIQFFVTKAEIERHEQRSLLDSLKDRLDILHTSNIYSTISKMISPEHLQKKDSADFVDQEYAHLLHKDTANLCNYLPTHITLLKEEMKSLNQEEQKFKTKVHRKSDLQSLDSALADIQSLEQQIEKKRNRTKLDFYRVCDRIAKLLNKPIEDLLDPLPIFVEVESGFLGSSFVLSDFTTTDSDKRKVLESLNHLADFHICDYTPKLIQYEHAVRQKTNELIIAKQNAIRSFVENMSIVSKLEQQVSRIELTVEEHLKYLDGFKEKYDGRGLESLQRILFSYDAIMIELFRRQEYKNMLATNADLVSNALSQFMSDEEKKRDYFRILVSKSFPFKLMDDFLREPPPQCKVTISGETESDGNDLRERGVFEYISLITHAYSLEPQPVNSINQPRHLSASNSKFQVEEKNLRKMVKEMSTMQDQFLTSAKKHVLSDTAESQPSQTHETINPQFTQINLFQDVQNELPVSVHSEYSTYSVVEDERGILVENIKLKSDLRVAAEINCTLEQKRQDLLKDLKTKNEIHDSLVNAMRRDFNTQLSELKAKFDEEKRIKDILETEHVSEIESMNVDYALKINQLINELREEQTKSTDLQNKLREEQTKSTDPQNKLREGQTKSTDLQNKLREEQTKSTDLQNKLREEQTKSTDLQNKLREEQTKSADLQNRLITSTDLQNKTNQMLQDFYKSRRAAKITLESKLASHAEQLTQLQNDLERKEIVIEKMQQTEKAATVTIKSLLKILNPKKDLSSMSLDLCNKNLQNSLVKFKSRHDAEMEKMDNATRNLEASHFKYNTLENTQPNWMVVVDDMEEYQKTIFHDITRISQLHSELGRATPNNFETVWSQFVELTLSVGAKSFFCCEKHINARARLYKKECDAVNEKCTNVFTVNCNNPAFSDFKVGDLALFLRGEGAIQGCKPWTAFNLYRPFYFLKHKFNHSKKNREWIIARISGITCHVANANNRDMKIYGLEAGTEYHIVDIEDWRLDTSEKI